MPQTLAKTNQSGDGRFGSGRVSTGTAERAAYAGKIAHQAIALAVAECVDPSGIELARVVARVLRDQGLQLSYRRSLQAEGLSALGVYWGWFRQPELKLLGAEVPTGTGRCDLVWEMPDARILIDEIKTGSRPGFTWRVDDQVRRYVAAAAVSYGSSFYGLRVCWLSAPHLSATFDGSLTKIAEGPFYQPVATGARLHA